MTITSSMSPSLNSGSRLPHGIIILNMGHNKFWAIKFLNMEQPKIHSKSNVMKPVFLAVMTHAASHSFPAAFALTAQSAGFALHPYGVSQTQANIDWNPLPPIKDRHVINFPVLTIHSISYRKWLEYRKQNFYYFPTIIPQHAKSNESIFEFYYVRIFD